MDLTEQQRQAVEQGEAVTLTLGQTRCVLIREDVYEQARKAAEYDDSPWTVEEMDLLAAEAAERLDSMEEIR